GVAQLTPKELTATAIYYYDLKLMSQMASLLDDQEESERYRIWSEEIKEAFNDKFFNSESKVYATGSQTSMAMPLCVGLVEEKNRKVVFENLVDSINASGKKLTAGDIGFHFLVQALHEGGASQLLYEMNYRDDVPGDGFQLRKGATALTESWAALEEVSNNHLMLGHIMEWFYSGLAGINQSQNSVGYKEIILRPEIVGDINYVKATHESVYGSIASEWKKTDTGFEMKVCVPANTTATVYLPASQTNKIFEGGNTIQKDFKNIIYKDGRAIIKIGSGNYEFIVQ
ncbi:MAG TPA: alpha-L-rhamnosidase C-terminal domain-containing protein, partial [Flavitalea sp.]|nr:alpha-L-rhamnosidase C-terminal domain-containing protein [Flavitalea sp.]